MHFKTLFFMVLTLSLNLCSMDSNPNMKKNMIKPLTTIIPVNPDTNDEDKTVEDIFGDVDKWMFAQSDSDTEEIINIPTPEKKRCYLSKKNCLLFVKNVIKYTLFGFLITYSDIKTHQYYNDACTKFKQLFNQTNCPKENNEIGAVFCIVFAAMMLEGADHASSLFWYKSKKNYIKIVILTFFLGAIIGIPSGILGSYI